MFEDGCATVLLGSVMVISVRPSDLETDLDAVLCAGDDEDQVLLEMYGL